MANACSCASISFLPAPSVSPRCSEKMACLAAFCTSRVPLITCGEQSEPPSEPTSRAATAAQVTDEAVRAVSSLLPALSSQPLRHQVTDEAVRAVSSLLPALSSQPLRHQVTDEAVRAVSSLLPALSSLKLCGTR
jgi:hypothetical protein